MPKSQSAIEFLTTYGFIFLIIAITLSLLYLFINFPRTILPFNCTIFSGFNCNDAIYTPNATVGSQLFIIVSDMMPGTLNITGFNAYMDFANSTSGYCAASIVTEGEKTYCIADISSAPRLGNMYSGTFKIIGNYCAQPLANITTPSCKGGNGYVYSGSINVQASKLNIGGIYYIPITITNTQNAAVPAHFQEEVSFNPSLINPLAERGDLGNIRFYYGGKEIYSWCESGCTSTSSDAIFWIRLPEAIPPSSSTVVDMYFLPTLVDYSGIHAGEAPELTTPYAKYDNGANVFNFYDSFSGTSLNTNIWDIGSQGTGALGTYNVSDGVNTTANATSAINIHSSSEFGYPAYFEWYSAPFVQGTSSINRLQFGNSGTTPQEGEALLMGAPGSVTIQYQTAAGTWAYSTSSPIPDSSGDNIYGVSANGTDVAAYFNYVPAVKAATTYVPTNVSFGAFLNYESGITSPKVYWVRVRAYPPDGIAPTISLGALTPA